MIGLGLLVVAGVITAGLFSGVESAFLACPRLKVRHLARRGNPKAQRMEHALRRPEPYITALLVGTNLAIIGGTVAATRFMDRLAPGRGEVLATAVMTPIFLVFSEILPKSYFLTQARRLCVPLAGPLEVIRTLVRPLAEVVGAPAKFLTRSASRSTVPASREELLLLARPGVSSVRLSPTISRLLEERIATAHRVAGDVMTPHDRVVTLPASEDVASVIPTVRATGLAHYPVEECGRWIGFVHVSDLLEGGGHMRLSELASRLPEVDQDAGLEEILDTMRDAAEHAVGVVHDGRHTGLVTLEDLVRHLTVGLEGSTP